MVSHLRSVIRIRTRVGKARADRFAPHGVGGRRRPGERAYEGVRGILNPPLARALRRADVQRDGRVGRAGEATGGGGRRSTGAR